MKYIRALLVVLLFAGTANAQTPNKTYWLVSAGFGSLFLPDPGINLDVTYPFDADGQTGIFNGAFPHPLPARVSVYDIPSFEVIFRHSAIDLGAGLHNNLVNDLSLYLKAGYKYILHVHDLLIEPGFDLYDLPGKNEVMGSIDNRSRDIDLFGFVGYATWEKSPMHLYYADHLDVDYRRTSIVLNPDLTIMINPAGKLFLCIGTGYFLQLAQASRINFIQRDQYGNTHAIGSLHLRNNGSVSGPFAGFRIGMAFGRQATLRHHFLIPF